MLVIPTTASTSAKCVGVSRNQRLLTFNAQGICYTHVDVIVDIFVEP